MIAPPLKSEVQPPQLSRRKESFSLSAPSPSRCRGCKFYRFEGSRSGHCQKLGVTVHSHWSACSLALAPFSLPWKLAQDLE